MMKLLDRARLAPRDLRGRPLATDFTGQELELAFAYFRGIVTASQVSRALKTSRQNVTNKMATILRSGIIDKTFVLRAA